MCIIEYQRSRFLSTLERIKNRRIGSDAKCLSLREKIIIESTALPTRDWNAQLCGLFGGLPN
jgi:hypothetical protein